MERPVCLQNKSQNQWKYTGTKIIRKEIATNTTIEQILLLN